MLAVKKIIDGEKLASLVDLPIEMQTGQVELIILPVQGRAFKSKSGDPALLQGYFKEYANPDLVALEKGAWERHVAEK